MLRGLLKWGARIVALASTVVCAQAPAQTVLFNEVHTVGAPTVAVPVEHSVSITTAGSYKVTLTDFGASLGAPLASVAFAVSNGSALVGTPQFAAGNLTFQATAPGTYLIHVAGTPGAGAFSGPFGLQVINTATNSAIATFSDNLALPQQALPNSEAVLATSVTVNCQPPPAPAPQTCTYALSLTDLGFPAPLAPPQLAMVQDGGALIQTLPTASTPPAYSAPVTLPAGELKYDIFAVGQTSATATGGLFSASLIGSGLSFTPPAVPVGGTTLVASPAIAAGSYNFALCDLQTPAALVQLQGALVLNGQIIPTPSPSCSPAPIASALGANTYQMFVFAAPATTPGAGSYAVEILPAGGGAAALSVARAVTTPGANLSAYSFDGSVPAAGGNFTVNSADIQFPSPLASLTVAAAQNGAVLGSPISGSGSTNIKAAGGPITLLAFSQAANAAGGLFGANITASGAATPAFEVTQGVGNAFAARQVPVTTPGNYAVTATDLAFPASFANFDVVVTRGTSNVGQIYGGGTFFFTGTPGNYFVNFIAQPTGSDLAGTYALTVATAPAAPVVSLTVNQTSVTSGSTVTLVWTSQNATSCTASGQWSGTQPLNGTVASSALSGDSQFKLTCSGPGGSASKSVSVTVTTPSGGKGGSLDTVALLVLLAVLAARLVMARSLGLPTVRPAELQATGSDPK